MNMVRAKSKKIPDVRADRERSRGQGRIFEEVLVEEPVLKPVSRSGLQKPGLKLSLADLLAQRKPYWITGDGEVVDLAAQGKDHALSAISILGDSQQGPEQAVMGLIDQGWIRVQAYPDFTAYVQGQYDALVQYGNRVLEIVPDLKSVEIAYVPADYQSPPSMTREEIDSLGWGGAVAHAKSVGKSVTKTRRS